MKRIIDIKGLVLGSVFVLTLSVVGVLWFGIALWKALLIGLACMVILGVVATFEDSDGSKDRGSDGH